MLPSFIKQAGMKHRHLHKMIMLLNETQQYSCKCVIQGSPAAMQMYQMSVSITQSSGMSNRILKILSHILLVCLRCTGSLMLVFMGHIVLYLVSSDFSRNQRRHKEYNLGKTSENVCFLLFRFP